MSKAWLAISPDGARLGRGQARAGRARRADAVAGRARGGRRRSRQSLDARSVDRRQGRRSSCAPTSPRSHVYRIQQLTTQGFYNGLTFHRVIPGFMAQGGDPQGTGQGGSPLPDLEAEFNDLPHLRGVASMARAESPNSANSQFFIVLAPTFKLDHKYTAFGRVIEGMAAVDAIAVGEPPAEPTQDRPRDDRRAAARAAAPRRAPRRAVAAGAVPPKP